MSGKSGAKPKAPKKEKCERQQKISRVLYRSLQDHFFAAGICSCSECLGTANNGKNPSYPQHWFGKTATVAKFTKKILLEMVKDGAPGTRETSIKIFNMLVGGEHGGTSDIIHMSRVSVEELSDGIEKLSAANRDVAVFLDLFHLLLLCSWKTDSTAVEIIFRSKQVCILWSILTNVIYMSILKISLYVHLANNLIKTL